MIEAKDRVALGAVKLDELRPSWFKRVRPPQMNDTHLCILGQVFGSYNRGLFVLDMSAGKGRQHGFLGYDQNDDRMLEQAWLLETRERLSGVIKPISSLENRS